MSDEIGAAAEPRERKVAATRAAEGSIEVEAPPDRVWRALTEAAELERWFPLQARVEPGEGGTIRLSWKNEYAGEARILVWEPARHLRASSSGETEGPAQVTDYLLEARGGRTFLRVVTSGFPADPSWDDWIEGTRLGWRYELRSLKHYLERHDGQDRRVVYLRRRVVLPPEEAWARLFGPGGFDERPLGGTPFDIDPPRQYAAIVADPPDAMLRISNEPTPGRPDVRDVTLWLAAWGDHARRMGEIEAEWSRLLERLFPEGHVP